MSIADAKSCLFSLGDTVGSVGLASLTYHEQINPPTFLYRMDYDHTYDLRFLRTNNSKTILLDRLRKTHFATTNASSAISVSQFFACVLSKQFVVGKMMPMLLSPQDRKSLDAIIDNEMNILTALQSPLLIYSLFRGRYIPSPILIRWRYGGHHHHSPVNHPPPSINNNHPPNSHHYHSPNRASNNRSSSTIPPIWLSFDTTIVPIEGKNSSRLALRVIQLPSSFSAPRDRNTTQTQGHVRQGGERDFQSNRESQSNRLSQIPPLKPSQMAIQDRETFYTSLFMHTFHEKNPSQISQSNPPHSSQISPSNLPNITHSIFLGQDGRVVYLPWLDVFLMIYTIIVPHHTVTPGITVISRSIDNKPGASTLGGAFKFSHPWRVIPPDWHHFGARRPDSSFPLWEWGGREKNWSPFVYNNTVLFIRHINPLTIVSVEEMDGILNKHQPLKMCIPEYCPEKITKSKIFSQSPYVEGLQWGHGPMILHSGPPALLIDNKYYLSFFHTQTRLSGSDKLTFFVGAYLFSAFPPFVLKAISRFPIIHRSFYTSEWDRKYGNHIDYSLVPTHVDVDHGMMYVHIEHQNTVGWVLVMNKNKLLKSMRKLP